MAINSVLLDAMSDKDCWITLSLRLAVLMAINDNSTRGQLAIAALDELAQRRGLTLHRSRQATSRVRVMPNGKKVEDCTQSELVEFAEWQEELEDLLLKRGVVTTENAP